jgi:hypothetical protein
MSDVKIEYHRPIQRAYHLHDIEIHISDLFRVWRSVVLYCPSILSILTSHQYQDA